MVISTFQKMMDPANISTSEMVADVIYTAATDGSNQLRYIAGADAEQFLAARYNMTDEEFVGMMKTQLQLS